MVVLIVQPNTLVPLPSPLQNLNILNICEKFAFIVHSNPSTEL